MELVAFITVVAILAAIMHYFSNRKYNAMMNKLPGPTPLPFVGNLWDLWQENFEILRLQPKLSAKYGPVVRVWMGPKANVLLFDPADIEVILSNTKHIDKSKEYSLLHSWVGTGLLTSTGKKWHTRRKLITPTFHFKILEQFVDVFHKNSNIMAQKFLEQKGPFDVYKLMSLCTLDIICETAMGIKINAQSTVNSAYVNAVNTACVAIFKRAMQVWLANDFVFNYLSAIGKEYNKSVDIMHHTTEEVIRKRQEERAKEKLPASATNTKEEDIGAKKKTAFLDHLLDANDAAGSVMTDLDIREEVDTFMFEGHDTTSAALTMALYLLAANPDVQEKAAQEVYEILGDSDRPTTHQDLQSMNYIERVIKETLRLYPSVPTFARETAEELVLPSGHVIPPGVSVNVSCYMMGRNPNVFPDPEKFDPDRFLPENTVGRHPYSYVPFSAGPRNCVGQKFAMLEMKSTISNVLRQCELSLPASDYKPKVVGMVVLKMPDGMVIQAKPRKFART